MTIQDSSCKNVYVGDGANKIFPITFCLPKNSTDVRVYVTENGQTNITSEYKIEENNVIYPRSGPPLPKNNRITIVRAIPAEQMLDLVNQGEFFTEDIEAALDKTIMLIQQLQEQNNRAITTPVVDDLHVEIPIAPGKMFGWNESGDKLITMESTAVILPKVALLLEDQARSLTRKMEHVLIETEIYTDNLRNDNTTFKTQITTTVATNKTEIQNWATAEINKIGTIVDNNKFNINSRVNTLESELRRDIGVLQDGKVEKDWVGAQLVNYPTIVECEQKINAASSNLEKQIASIGVSQAFKDYVANAQKGLASESYVDTAVANLEDSTLARITRATNDKATIRYVDQSVNGLATVGELQLSINDLKKSLTGYINDSVYGKASEGYVDGQIEIVNVNIDAAFLEAREADSKAAQGLDSAENARVIAVQGVNNAKAAQTTADRKAEQTEVNAISQKLTETTNKVEKILQAEEGTITLSNNELYPFNNSQQTIALKHRTNSNYIVLTGIESAMGNAGKIEVSEQLNNGFKIKFTGSASSITVKYKILGGE